ncbi:MAG: molybdopterin molybdotransferase MoeA [Myxococcota bacterium]|jgi:molybdopterin molybdotransferase|nr:molybdopterin molybdotransferase MoeA [Myxococcota bacterium]
MISIEEAQHQIINTLEPLDEQTVNISAALHRVCTENIYARENSPLFDNSAMDGYALKAEDTLNANQTNPITLEVLDKIPAGSPTTHRLTNNQSCRIFTGAPMPQGADAVIMQENTEAKEKSVEIYRPMRSKENVRFAGEDICAQDLLYQKGDILDAGAIGLLAAQGIAQVKVSQRPKIAVVPTGDEIVELGQNLQPGQIRNSNAYMLAAQVEQAGAQNVKSPIAYDTLEALRHALTQSAKNADLIITCGGVSVGEFDLVRKIIEEEGSLNFWRVAVKPGKPLLFGHFNNTPLIGLPGNPVSAFVCFELFVRLAIKKLQGAKPTKHDFEMAILNKNVKPNKKRTEFLRGKCFSKDKSRLVEPHSKRGSGHLSSITHINTLIEIPPGEKEIQAGTYVKILSLKN